MQHPFLDSMFIAAAIACLAIAVFTLTTAWRRLDDHLEDRRELRLDAAASREIRKQLVDTASSPNIPGQRTEGDAS